MTVGPSDKLDFYAELIKLCFKEQCHPTKLRPRKRLRRPTASVFVPGRERLVSHLSGTVSSGCVLLWQSVFLRVFEQVSLYFPGIIFGWQVENAPYGLGAACFSGHVFDSVETTVRACNPQLAEWPA